MLQVKFGDLKITDKAIEHINDCISTDCVTMGPKCALLEEKWSELYPNKDVHTTLVNSGTSAVMAACMALYEFRAHSGNEIICPGLSFIATANAIRAAGFRPVFVDVRKDTMLIKEEDIEGAVTDNTAAIMPVTIMGKSPNMIKIREIADKYNLKVIVDNCEGHFCHYKGKLMEDYADYVTYSFYIAHVIQAGECGAVTCKNKDHADLIRSIRSHGRPPDSVYFDHVRFGLNFKPNDLTASVGLGQVDDFWDIFNKRTDNMNYFHENLKFLRNIAWVTWEEKECRNSPHAYSVTLSNNDGRRDNLRQKMLDAGIETKINFGAMPDHGAFDCLGLKGSCPNSTYVGSHGLHWSVSQYLTEEQREHIVQVVTKFFKASK